MVAGIYQHGKLLLLVAGIYISLLTHRLEVTCAFFNISRLNKSCQYFKMVDKKNNITFHISEQFQSFQSLQEKISSYETEKFVKLWIRDSRYISAARGRVKRKLSEEIRYYELTYACIQYYYYNFSVF